MNKTKARIINRSMKDRHIIDKMKEIHRIRKNNRSDKDKLNGSLMRMGVIKLPVHPYLPKKKRKTKLINSLSITKAQFLTKRSLNLT